MAKRALGDILVDHGEVTRDQVDAALHLQRTAPDRLRLGQILVREGLLDEMALARGLAESHGLRAVDLGTVSVTLETARLVARDVALRSVVVPIAVNGVDVTVAVADPVDVIALDDLRSALPNHRVAAVVAPASQIQELLDRAWRDERNAAALRRIAEQRPALADTPASESADDGAAAIVNQLLITAAHRRASDLHVEPQSDRVRVRLRVDGMMSELMTLPVDSLASVVARIKIVSGLDVFERRVPQDGRTKLRLAGQNRDIRVSTLPTIHGEKVVLRLLPAHSDLPLLERLGLLPHQQELLRRSLTETQGVILVTGPTGAGKSHTLYAALAETADDQRNVITVEDPVEVEMPGITQVQVTEGGVTFDSGLRAALRQDPDVLMIGEIRDTVTGTMAARAALTGHLVLSTLHTNDSPGAVHRLVDLGVPRYLVGASLSLVVAQRLLRRVCAGCEQPARPSPDVLSRLAFTPAPDDTLVSGAGCAACAHTGYRGRIGCFEVMVVSENMRAAIGDGAGERELRSLAAASGWRPLEHQALDLARAGVTTCEEVLRVTSPDADVPGRT